MLLQMVDGSRGKTLDEIATRSMKKAGLKQVSGSSATINGLEAHLGKYDGQLDDMGHVLSTAAHVVMGTNVYLLAGFAQPEAFARVDSEFDDTIHSFRRLSRAEADRIQPNRLDVYVVRRGDTWQSIAQHAGAENVKASTLAIMNGRPVVEQPNPGDRVKIVVAEDDARPAVADRRSTAR
jgi:predicted Zn-dependent protease